MATIKMDSSDIHLKNKECQKKIFLNQWGPKQFCLCHGLLHKYDDEISGISNSQVSSKLQSIAFRGLKMI